MLILSIHLGHDSSICVLNDGNLEQYFLVERYTRKKHDDDQSIILKLIDDICNKLDQKLDVVTISNFNTRDDIILKIFEECKKYNSDVKLMLQQDHHLNHASLAFYNSGFDESIVVVVDGAGSTIRDNLVEVESVFVFDKHKNSLIYKNIIEDSNPFDLSWEDGTFGVGKLYDIAAILIGNTPDDCGKAMGLSSYGSDNKSFKKLFLEKNIFNNDFYKNSSEEIKQFLKNPIKIVDSKNYKLHADFCYEVQHQTQKVVGDLIEESIIRTGIKKVCISGGYGMNIVANYYYLQRFSDVQFYFEPLCNDNGISIGAAMNSYLKITNKIPNGLQTTSFHGISHEISSYKGETSSIKNIANLLNQNKSIAVYSGLAEAGQRALGNRSIFFNPLNIDAKNIVNKIKKREWYRPFACVVLEEDADVYFNMGELKSSPFMTICFPVRSKYVKIMPGITHIDNTCRIQTISKGNSYLYELLQEFKKLSGYGILLNTSFNLSGEPLVETPIDAFNTLNNSCLDYLWFEETRQLFYK